MRSKKNGSYTATCRCQVEVIQSGGLPLYESRNGRLYHPGRYSLKCMLAISVTAHSDQLEAQNFVLTMERVAENLLYKKRVVLQESHAVMNCPAESAQMVHEVLQDLLQALELIRSQMPDGLKGKSLIAARFPKILQVPCCMMLNQMHLRQARKLGLDVYVQPFRHSGEASGTS